MWVCCTVRAEQPAAQCHKEKKRLAGENSREKRILLSLALIKGMDLAVVAEDYKYQTVHWGDHCLIPTQHISK